MQNDELRRVQEELEKARAKYFDLFDLAPVGYFTIAEDGKILEANLTGARLLGIEKSRLLNKHFSLFVAPDSQDAFYFHKKNVIETSMQQTCELRLLRKNGRPFFVQLESLPNQSAQNGFNQIRTSVIDITEKTQAVAALQKRLTQSELLLNFLPHPAMLIDENRKILAANQLARKNGARVGGYLPSDIGRLTSPSRTPGGSARNIPLCARPGEATRNTAQGGPAHSHEKTCPPQKGQPYEGVFFLADSEQNQQRLVTVVEDSNDAVTVLDFDGSIKAWNQGAEKIYGYSASEALKLTVFDLIPPSLKRETLTLLQDIQSGVLIPAFETRRVAKDGSQLDIRVTATRLIQNEKFVAIATTERDVTQHNRELASIKELPLRIILAQEKERDRISKEIHSDFGQSLIALKMFVSMSVSDLGKSSSQGKQVLEQVKSRLGLIINRARDLSHELAPPSLRYIGLLMTIRNLVESLKEETLLKIHFFHRNMGGVTFDFRDIIIYRIVQEALNNIFKHAKATDAWIKAIYRNSIFFLEIQDNGRGFDPAKTPKSGGLGLDLLREHAELVHGALSIESRIGKGTTIKVSIPIKRPKSNE